MATPDWLSGSLLAGTANIQNSNSRAQIYLGTLIAEINNLSNIAKSKIAIIQVKGSAMSIADMFDLQMVMNKLSQFSEMSTSIISALNTAAQSMARNVKG